MKIKALYLILLVTLLVSACSPGIVATNQAAELPVAQAEEIPPAVAQEHGSSSGQEPPGGEEMAPGQPPDGRTPPQEAIDACNGKSEQESCEFTSPKGAETGVCEMVQDRLACSPQHGQPGKEQTGGNPPAGGNASGEGAAYDVEQALSDRAQRTTISFDALAFLTGDLGADSFFPPGKVADFWGFQYLRDNDPSQMGHNTDFLTKAALNMLHILTPDQRAELMTLAEGQADSINE